MNAKQQLAYNLNQIITEYNEKKNVRRFYKKITLLNSCISKNSQKELFDDYKIDIKRVYDDIINGEEDETIVNDCINDLRKITLGLLFFD
jgi:hypothetical protein